MQFIHRIARFSFAAALLLAATIASAQTPQGTVSTDGTGTSGVYAEAFSAYRDVTIKTGNATTSGFRVFNSASTELFRVSSARRILVLD